MNKDRRFLNVILTVVVLLLFTFTCYAQSARDLYHLGLQYHKAGDEGTAMSEFQKAVDLNPQYYQAYSVMGNIERKNANIVNAIEDFSKVIEIKPQDFGAYYNRGNLYSKQGNYAQAINDYNQAIQIKPDSDAAIHNRDLAERMLQANSDNNKVGKFPEFEEYKKQGNLDLKQQNEKVKKAPEVKTPDKVKNTVKSSETKDQN